MGDIENAIKIQVRAQYLPDQSVPNDDRYVFGYTIKITNEGHRATQLISRHWIITDAEDAVQEAQGKGVIGQQPTIAPGASYTYSSGVVIATETGTMTGTYQMQAADDGEAFEATIPVFALVPPHRLH